MKNSNTKNKAVVLISGVCSGIGQATAHRLAERGYRVFGTSRQPDRGASVPGVEMLELDVCHPQSVQQCVEQVLDSCGKIDVLINNSGYLLTGSLEESSEAEMKAQFETNFFGLARLTQAVLPVMRSARSGRIINVSSLVGFATIPFVGFYSASKFAVEGYSEALYHEVMPFGIHVSLIEPGTVRTHLYESAKTVQTTISDYAPWKQQATKSLKEHAEKGITPEHVAATIITAIESPQPHLRYTVGPDAKLVSRLKRFVPAKVFHNKIWRHEFGLDKVQA